MALSIRQRPTATSSRTEAVLYAVATAPTVSVELGGVVEYPPLPPLRSVDATPSAEEVASFSASLWSARLPHGFGVASRRASSSYDRDVLEYFTELAQLEEQYASGLQRLNERRREVQYASTQHAWLAVQQAVREAAQSHRVFAGEVLATVVQPLKSAVSQARTHEAESLSLSLAALDKVKQSRRRARDEATTYARLLHRYRKEARRENTRPATAPEAVLLFEAARSCADAVSAANASTAHFETHVEAQAVDALQEHEERRLEALTSAFDAFAASTERSQVLSTASRAELRRASDAVKVGDDICGFAATYASGAARATDPLVPPSFCNELAEAAEGFEHDQEGFWGALLRPFRGLAASIFGDDGRDEFPAVKHKPLTSTALDSLAALGRQCSGDGPEIVEIDGPEMTSPRIVLCQGTPVFTSPPPAAAIEGWRVEEVGAEGASAKGAKGAEGAEGAASPAPVESGDVELDDDLDDLDDDVAMHADRTPVSQRGPSSPPVVPQDASLKIRHSLSTGEREECRRERSAATKERPVSARRRPEEAAPSAIAEPAEASAARVAEATEPTAAEASAASVAEATEPTAAIAQIAAAEPLAVAVDSATVAIREDSPKEALASLAPAPPRAPSWAPDAPALPFSPSSIGRRKSVAMLVKQRSDVPADEMEAILNSVDELVTSLGGAGLTLGEELDIADDMIARLAGGAVAGDGGEQGSSELDAGLDPATFEEGEWFYQEANGDVSAPLTWDEMRTLAGDAIILADMCVASSNAFGQRSFPNLVNGAPLRAPLRPSDCPFESATDEL